MLLNVLNEGGFNVGDEVTVRIDDSLKKQLQLRNQLLNLSIFLDACIGFFIGWYLTRTLLDPKLAILGGLAGAVVLSVFSYFLIGIIKKISQRAVHPNILVKKVIS